MGKIFSPLQFCNMQVSLHNNKSCHLPGSFHCLKQCWKSFDFKILKVKNDCMVTTTMGLTTSVAKYSKQCLCFPMHAFVFHIWITFKAPRFITHNKSIQKDVSRGQLMTEIATNTKLYLVPDIRENWWHDLG
jgi:hypothetical protein